MTIVMTRSDHHDVAKSSVPQPLHVECKRLIEPNTWRRLSSQTEYDSAICDPVSSKTSTSAAQHNESCLLMSLRRRLAFLSRNRRYEFTCLNSLAVQEVPERLLCCNIPGVFGTRICELRRGEVASFWGIGTAAYHVSSVRPLFDSLRFGCQESGVACLNDPPLLLLPLLQICHTTSLRR